MSMKVFANGREIAGKASDGKSIACFPDVCMSPPPPIAGPVPIPYPNTAFASDTTSGSKTVKLHGKEAMLKDKSFFKKSTGDEPATPNLGGGVITKKITGKVYFASFSMDVFIEGENVVRHLDLTTHNHGSVPGNTATWPYIARPTGAAVTGPCEDDAKKEQDACKDFTPHNKDQDAPDVCDVVGANVSKKDDVNTDAKAKNLEKRIDKNSKPRDVEKADYEKASECMSARRCQLAAIEPKGKQARCCKGQTAHHLVPASALHDQGRGGATKNKQGKKRTSAPLKGISNYDQATAPCVCVEGTNQNHGSHGRLHTFTSYLAQISSPTDPEWMPLDESTTKLIDAAHDDTPMASRKHVRSNGAGGFEVQTRTLRYDEARDQSIAALQTAFPGSGCSTKCLKAQLDAYHKKKCGMKNNTKVKTVVEGHCEPEDVTAAGGMALLSDAHKQKTKKPSRGI